MVFEPPGRPRAASRRADHTEVGLLDGAARRVVLVGAAQQGLDTRADLDAADEISIAWRPRSWCDPRSLRTSTWRSDWTPTTGVTSSISPSTIVCSGRNPPARSVDDSSSTVQPVMPLIVCSSWMNFLNAPPTARTPRLRPGPSSTMNVALREYHRTPGST